MNWNFLHWVSHVDSVCTVKSATKNNFIVMQTILGLNSNTKLSKMNKMDRVNGC